MRKGKMSEQVIESEYLHEKMSLKIYTPEGYSPFQQYHICIMQDGNDYFQMGRVASVSDQLHEDGDIEHTIFIGIHYLDKYDRRKKYHPDGEQQDAYRSEEHTSELQSRGHIVCRLLLEKKKIKYKH